MLDKDRSTVHRCGTLILGVFLEKMNPPTPLLSRSSIPSTTGTIITPPSPLILPPHLWKVWNRWGNKPTAFHSQWSVCKSMQMNMQHTNQSCPSHRLKERQESRVGRRGRERALSRGKVGQGNLAGLFIFARCQRERGRKSERASRWMMWVWLETKRCTDMVGEWAREGKLWGCMWKGFCARASRCPLLSGHGSLKRIMKATAVCFPAQRQQSLAFCTRKLLSFFHLIDGEHKRFVHHPNQKKKDISCFSWQ